MSFYPDDDLFIDANGCPTERVLMGGLEVIVHYDEVPELDMLGRSGAHLLRKLLSR